MISPYHRAPLGTVLVLLLMSGCAAVQKARMDPTLPIDTSSGYTQNGRELDPDSMVKHLSAERDARPYVKRARPLALVSSLMAGAGGALVGWPLGDWAAGGQANWNLAYAGAGMFAVAIPLAIWAGLSMRKAVDSHNALVRVEPAPMVHKAPPQIVRRGSLLFTESDLSGISLTWLGMVAAKPKLALRFQRSSSTPNKEQCQHLEVTVDGRSMQPASTYKADSQGAQVRETVQAELDADALKGIAASQQTTFTVCGRSRRLTTEAADAGARFLREYQSIAAQTPTDAATIEPEHAQEPVEVVQSAKEPGAPEALRDTAAP